MIIDGDENVPVRMMVDLGTRNTLTIPFNTKKKLYSPENTIDGITGTGVQGAFKGKTPYEALRCILE